MPVRDQMEPRNCYAPKRDVVLVVGGGASDQDEENSKPTIYCWWWAQGFGPPWQIDHWDAVHLFHHHHYSRVLLSLCQQHLAVLPRQPQNAVLPEQAFLALPSVVRLLLLLLLLL